MVLSDILRELFNLSSNNYGCFKS